MKTTNNSSDRKKNIVKIQNIKNITKSVKTKGNKSNVKVAFQ